MWVEWESSVIMICLFASATGKQLFNIKYLCNIPEPSLVIYWFKNICESLLCAGTVLNAQKSRWINGHGSCLSEASNPDIMQAIDYSKLGSYLDKVVREGSSGEGTFILKEKQEAVIQKRWTFTGVGAAYG